MTRRRIAFAGALAALATIASITAPAFPQDTDPATTAQGEPKSSDAAVKKILEEQESLLRGMPFAYQPAGRRDPFRPLVQAGQKGPGDKCKGEGIQCMGVSELDLSGIVRDPENGDVALVIGTDNKGYFLRTGDRVYDGTVISVDSRQGVVMFRQRIDDPRVVKPYRDVPKRLVPLDEEKSK